MLVEYHLPLNTLTNFDLESLYPDFTADKIKNKVGIQSRHIAQKNEFAIDLGFNAANKLFESKDVRKEDIDFLIFCTQSPENALPSGSAILQHKLGLPKSIGAIDINQGCSGYIYGLFLCHALIKSKSCKMPLLITSDTYSKYISPADKSNRSIFGDGASATVFTNEDVNFIDFELGTDGSGCENLVAYNSCLKHTEDFNSPELYMNGTEIFNFTIKNIPSLVSNILERNNFTLKDIDLVIFHQANKFMLNHLRKKIGIPEEKFIIDMEDTGNTVSSSIPIILSKYHEEVKTSKRILLCGFGVGYSWGACIIENNNR